MEGCALVSGPSTLCSEEASLPLGVATSLHLCPVVWFCVIHGLCLPNNFPIDVAEPPKPWGRQGLCSPQAHLWATSDFAPALKDWGPPR